MRIIAGKYRGTRLAALGKGDESARLRPTPDRVRESLFSMLTHRSVLHGAVVLDVFAGTGALGLEALSRGAQSVVFIENGRTGQRLIQENIDKLQASGETQILRADATRLGAWPHAPFDLVFLDPPYGKSLGEKAIERLRDGNWLARNALLVVEDSTAKGPLEGFERLDHRRFGESHITLLSAKPAL